MQCTKNSANGVHDALMTALADFLHRLRVEKPNSKKSFSTGVNNKALPSPESGRKHCKNLGEGVDKTADMIALCALDVYAMLLVFTCAHYCIHFEQLLQALSTAACAYKWLRADVVHRYPDYTQGCTRSTFLTLLTTEDKLRNQLIKWLPAFTDNATELSHRDFKTALEAAEPLLTKSGTFVHPWRFNIAEKSISGHARTFVQTKVSHINAFNCNLETLTINEMGENAANLKESKVAVLPWPAALNMVISVALSHSSGIRAASADRSSMLHGDILGNGLRDAIDSVRNNKPPTAANLLALMDWTCPALMALAVAIGGPRDEELFALNGKPTATYIAASITGDHTGVRRITERIILQGEPLHDIVRRVMVSDCCAQDLADIINNVPHLRILLEEQDVKSTHDKEGKVKSKDTWIYRIPQVCQWGVS